jgi:hypothetical protein
VGQAEHRSQAVEARARGQREIMSKKVKQCNEPEATGRKSRDKDGMCSHHLLLLFSLGYFISISLANLKWCREN